MICPYTSKKKYCLRSPLFQTASSLVRDFIWTFYFFLSELQELRKTLSATRKKKTIGSITTTLPCITLFVHFFQLLYDYDVNIPNFRFYGRSKHKTTMFFFFLWAQIQSYRIQLLKKIANIWQLIKRVRIRTTNYESAQINFLGHVSSALADSYAGIESDSLVYGVILARDLCHAQCNLKDPQHLAPFASLLGYGHSPVLFLPRGC